MANLQQAHKTGADWDTSVPSVRQGMLQRMVFSQTPEVATFGRPRAVQASEARDEMRSGAASKEAKGSFKVPSIGGAKENSVVAVADMKRRLAAKVAETKISRAGAAIQGASTTERRRLSFSLRPFNSVRLGPKPTIRKERGKAQTVYFLHATQPVAREMKLNGLTLRVKFTAN